MKRLIVAVAVLAVILGVCYAESAVTNNFENEVQGYIQSIKSSRESNDDEACRQNIKALQNHFEKSEIFLSVFTNKEVVDDIERSVYRLSDFLLSDNDALFFSEISNLETEMKELKRTSGIYLNSIF